MGDMADLLNQQIERGRSILQHKETGEYEVKDNINLMYGSKSWKRNYNYICDYTEEKLNELTQ